MNKTSVNPPKPPKPNNARAVASDMFAIVQSVMRGSQGEMVSLVEKYDLSFTQLKLMYVLQQTDEPQPIGGLADTTTTSLPAAGRAVDGLVRHELVTRTEDPDDRRVKRIELTPLGTKEMDTVQEARVRTLDQFLKQLSGDEIAALHKAIQPLRAAAAPQKEVS
jgi:DNA-binding MarR family transcriptional regulator